MGAADPATATSEQPEVKAPVRRSLSLARAVDAAGGIDAWNMATAEARAMTSMLDSMVKAESIEQTTADLRAILKLGSAIWAYGYMRTLYQKNLELFYATLLENPKDLVPVVRCLPASALAPASEHFHSVVLGFARASVDVR